LAVKLDLDYPEQLPAAVLEQEKDETHAFVPQQLAEDEEEEKVHEKFVQH
jgi:hypothetical protein